MCIVEDEHAAERLREKTAVRTCSLNRFGAIATSKMAVKFRIENFYGPKRTGCTANQTSLQGCVKTAQAMTKRPVFVITLRPLPGVDPVRALRAALKLLLRRFGLRCVSISER